MEDEKLNDLRDLLKDVGINLDKIETEDIKELDTTNEKAKALDSLIVEKERVTLENKSIIVDIEYPSLYIGPCVVKAEFALLSNIVNKEKTSDEELPVITKIEGKVVKVGYMVPNFNNIYRAVNIDTMKFKLIKDETSVIDCKEELLKVLMI